jgi:hypothetical protein
MERLGKPRHRREDRRLSELEVSESNLSIMLLFVSPPALCLIVFADSQLDGKLQAKYNYAA